MNQMSALLRPALLRSPPLADVSHEAWEEFANALSIWDTGPREGRARDFGERRNGYGCYGIRPLRLVDLGVASDVKRVDGKPTIAIFRPTKSAPTPEFAERSFLASPMRQYETLCVSISHYDRIRKVFPSEMTRSGALALFHRLGPLAIEKWAKHQEDSTKKLFNRANGIF